MAAVTAPRLAVSGASVGLGVLVAWAWNAAIPQVPMPAEVAAVVGAVPELGVEEVPEGDAAQKDREVCLGG